MFQSISCIACSWWASPIESSFFKTMNTQLNSDKLAMALSFVCALHCLFVPSFFILSSGFLAISLNNLLVHQLLLIFVVPVSLYALISGYRNHKITWVLLSGVSGLILLFLAVFLGPNILGEFYEKALTLMGSTIVAFSHFKNYQVCRKLDCVCHD